MYYLQRMQAAISDIEPSPPCVSLIYVDCSTTFVLSVALMLLLL